MLRALDPLRSLQAPALPGDSGGATLHLLHRGFAVLALIALGVLAIRSGQLAAKLAAAMLAGVMLFGAASVSSGLNLRWSSLTASLRRCCWPWWQPCCVAERQTYRTNTAAGNALARPARCVRDFPCSMLVFGVCRRCRRGQFADLGLDLDGLDFLVLVFDLQRQRHHVALFNCCFRSISITW